jgi:dTDP-4-dehydrorhamnose 3,5-epimerase
MKYTRLDIPDLVQITLERRGDDRGFFARLFCGVEFAQRGLAADWVQINNSLTVQKGTVRGLHFQYPPSSEVKLVRCIRGSIFDVGVDLREGSPTFGQWAGIELSADNRDMLYLPAGFAHGFQALTDDSEIIYFNSAAYAPELESGLRHDDPDVAIRWPLPVTSLSARDQTLQSLAEVRPVTVQTLS